MACPHRWIVVDKSSRQFLGYAPCGRCVNCLVDWRNSYEDLCEEELFQRNFCASYLTVTYDDYHLDWRDDWHGSLVPSINKLDAVKFIKRLRAYMCRHKINTPLMQKNFRYVVAAEYGEEKNRPHLHFVFFGLDYRVADKMFRECWKCGNQKLLPVKRGCFRYVVGYMQKQVKSCDNPADMYECRNRERPFFHHSRGLGKTLFLRQWDFIRTHDYYYKSRKGVLRPLPVYYMRRYRLLRADDTIPQKIVDWKNYYPNKTFSLKAYNEHKHNLAKIRESNLISALRKSGEAVNDSMCYDIPPDYVDLTRECRSAVRDYLGQLVVDNQTVINYKKSLEPFIGPDGSFVRSAMFPSYQNYRQAAYDLDRYGDLLPF